MIEIKLNKKFSLGFQVQLEFNLAQHKIDKQLIRSLIKYFECGHIYENQEVVHFKVCKFSDLINKIIPFFQKHPVLGVKALDFAY